MNDEYNRSSSSIDFSRLYDEHSEYAARRITGSYEEAQILLEATAFKIPNLIKLLPQAKVFRSVFEIGCATGELIGNFPIENGGLRVGCDISKENIKTASLRFPDVEFFSGNFMSYAKSDFDSVVLSDVLEHVDDDENFLRQASTFAEYILVNLPLEDNWLNSCRAYGPNDVSGHLRRYSLQQGLDLFSRSGLKIINYHQVWIHETSVDSMRRHLRREFLTSDFSGGGLLRVIKQCCLVLAYSIKPFGRRLFASNLFVLAVKDII